VVSVRVIVKKLTKLLGDHVELQVLDPLNQIGVVTRVGHDAKHVRLGAICPFTGGYWPTAAQGYHDPEKQFVIVRDEDLVGELEASVVEESEGVEGGEKA
jgi:hypothetical protein